MAVLLPVCHSARSLCIAAHFTLVLPALLTYSASCHLHAIANLLPGIMSSHSPFRQCNWHQPHTPLGPPRLNRTRINAAGVEDETDIDAATVHLPVPNFPVSRTHLLQSDPTSTSSLTSSSNGAALIGLLNAGYGQNGVSTASTLIQSFDTDAFPAASGISDDSFSYFSNGQTQLQSTPRRRQQHRHTKHQRQEQGNDDDSLLLQQDKYLDAFIEDLLCAQSTRWQYDDRRRAGPASSSLPVAVLEDLSKQDGPTAAKLFADLARAGNIRGALQLLEAAALSHRHDTLSRWGWGTCLCFLCTVICCTQTSSHATNGLPACCQ